jgi:hypothetical protein
VAPRLQLHDILLEIIGVVYFQPPVNLDMQFPCIVYSRDGSNSDRADNGLYRHAKRYQVTVIDRNPDSQLPDRVEGLPLCNFDRWFAVDNLNHWVFTLFF